jgi:hypothetical protein
VKNGSVSGADSKNMTNELGLFMNKERFYFEKLVPEPHVLNFQIIYVCNLKNPRTKKTKAWQKMDDLNGVVVSNADC